MKVNVLDEDRVLMSLEFSIRETTCLKDSREDPSTCAFQRGYYVVSVAERDRGQETDTERATLLPWLGSCLAESSQGLCGDSG